MEKRKKAWSKDQFDESVSKIEYPKFANEEYSK